MYERCLRQPHDPLLTVELILAGYLVVCGRSGVHWIEYLMVCAAGREIYGRELRN
jgi:hypothetical protein